MIQNSKSFFSVFLFIFCLSATFFIQSAHAGPKLELSEDSWLKLSVLGQAHYSHMDNAAAEHDFYLRRGRIIIDGQIMDGAKFFVETDNDNAGKNGAPSSSTDIQDAFVDVRLGHTDHWLKAGLILLPFSFENRSSAASLLGIDYNSETIKFVNAFVWRDYGAELNGNFGEKFAYRIGVFDGYDSDSGIKNNDAALRYTGHIAYNLIGNAETGWFFSQDRKGKSDYLSIGAGYDNQNDATITNSIIEDNTAWVADFQSSITLVERPLTINGAYYDWDNSYYKGKTAFVEAGYQINKVMPTVKISYLDPDSGASTTDTTVGLHYFLKDHNARAGIEYRTGDSDDWVLVGVQFLL